ncbi:MAG: hypothetical protein R3A44_23535 [Caldilineaceae bacterium]
MTLVFEYMWEYSGMLLVALALLVVQAICDLALPDFMADIVNTGVLNGNAFILQVGLKMIGITLLGAASSIVVGYFAAGLRHLSRAICGDLFRRVQTFSNPELDKFSTAS